MIDVAMPKSFLSFADALRMLAQSSLDATEIVTKWDEITNADIPSVVKITISGTTHEVPNLAKVRRDLAEGLSLDTPTVKMLKLSTYQASGTVDATGSYGANWKSAGSIPYRTDSGWLGVYRNVFNDFHSVCIPDKRNVAASFLELPRVVMMGVASAVGSPPQDTLDLHVSAPSAVFVQTNTLVNSAYYTTVLFVNRNVGALMSDGTPEHSEGLPVTLNIYDVSGTLLFTKVIAPKKSLHLYMFAFPNAGTVNVQEIVYGV